MDRNANEGFIALYIREDISLRKTSFKNVDKDIRTLILDISSTSIAQKWSFLLRISSVNVTKSAVSFGHVYWTNP